MRKYILISFMFSLVSCSDTIEMKSVYTSTNIDIKGNLFFHYVNGKVIDGNDPITVHYNNANNKLTINDIEYPIISKTIDSIVYNANDIIYVIKFNTGYVWQGSTKTKFDIFILNNTSGNKDIYVYNN